MPTGDPPEKQIGQVFAAERPHRHRAMRAGVAMGAALIMAWLLALAFGVFGATDPFPGLHLGGGGDSGPSDNPVAETTPAAEALVPGSPPPAVTGESTGSTGAANSPTGSSPGGGTSSPTSPSTQAPATAPAPTPTTGTGSTTTPGAPTGAGSTDGAGKPSGTPGIGTDNPGQGKSLDLTTPKG